jgi:hypothetical protein
MIFSEDDSSYSLKITPFTPETKFDMGMWLVIAGTNEIPPHIALISDGKYYSVSTRKIDRGTSLERFMNTIERKQVPAIFLRILNEKPERTDIIARNEAISSNTLLQSIYENLNPLGINEHTCLSPIKTFFAEYYSPDFATVNFVFELLALAKNKGLIKQCFSLFSEPSHPNNITLPKYSMADIQNKIKELSLQTASVKH